MQYQDCINASGSSKSTGLFQKLSCLHQTHGIEIAKPNISPRTCCYPPHYSLKKQAIHVQSTIIDIMSGSNSNSKISTSSSSGTTVVGAKPSAKKGSSTSASSASTAATAAPAAVAVPVTTTTPRAPSNNSNSINDTALTRAPSTLKKLPRESFTKQTPAPPNSFQEALEELDEEKQISYLMLGATEVLPDFNVKRTHPYSYFFFKKKGYKQVFQPNKNIIVQEIKRRQPEAKPNQNNRSNDELMEMLRERWPLVEPDKQYIVQKEKDYRKLLVNALHPREVICTDELANLAAASATAEGLAAVAAISGSHNNSSRKRSIGETVVDLASSPSRRSTLGKVVGGGGGGGSNFHSYYGGGGKRRTSTTSSTNGKNGHSSTASSSALETMLLHAANACADKLSYANLATTVESLKKERFDLNLKKLPLVSKHTPGNVQSIAFMDNRIKEITDSILVYEAKMGIPAASADV
ncbi:unnamed protein product [Cylindrotheca closterium]|uniref:Uncharacterized protein n=1 Tax=Cylindrotheca closterium TaxID=2856 RepID=A0AAD2CNA2_9STRA|nr:unnamed protein product [Cylindrotheca closterium]